MKCKTAQLDWREGQRGRARELTQHGWHLQDISAALGMTPRAVRQWFNTDQADAPYDQACCHVRASLRVICAASRTNRRKKELRT
jgi:hypothetical protein